MSQPPNRRSDNRFQRRPGGRPEGGGGGGGRRFPSSSSGPPPRWGAGRRPEGSGDRPPFERGASEGRSYGGKPYEGKNFEAKPYERKPYQGQSSEGRSFEGKRPGYDRSGPPRSGSPRSGPPRSGLSRSGPERLGGERPNFDRPRSERSWGERPGGDRAGSDRAGGDRARFDRPGAERFSRPSADRRPSRDGRPFNREGGAGSRDNRPSFDRPRFGAEGPQGWRDGDRRPRPGSRGTFGRPPTRSFSATGATPLASEGLEEQESFSADAPSDLVWGRHSSLAVLEGGRPVHRVWCTPEMRFSPRFLQLLREAKASGVLVEEVTWARLGQISGGAVHQGIVLQPAAAETLDLTSLIEGCSALGEAPLLMAVDGLTDPHNLGAILRSAEALGAHGMVLPQRRNAGLTGSVAKVAAGALEHLPVARVVNLNRSLETLKQEGYRVIGLAEEGSVTLEEANLEGPLVVVTGSEGDGLSLLTRRNCDQLVRIPLRGATPSLNASVATALLLYEIARRGWMAGLQGTAPAPRLVRPAMASTPLVGLDEAAAADDAAELDDPLEASGDPTPAGHAPEDSETLPSGPLEIPAQQPPAPQPVQANRAAEPIPGAAAPSQSEPLAEPWQATIAAGETLANGASSQDSSPGNDHQIGEPTPTPSPLPLPSPPESAPSPELGLEVVAGIGVAWGSATAPSLFDNDIRL
ncbi:MAG: 23S rRNA (guanosine(2251)-2'-O)-methyltransferase RlmB [Cyanobacteriota bacterium]